MSDDFRDIEVPGAHENANQGQWSLPGICECGTDGWTSAARLGALGGLGGMTAEVTETLLNRAKLRVVSQLKDASTELGRSALRSEISNEALNTLRRYSLKWSSTNLPVFAVSPPIQATVRDLVNATEDFAAKNSNLTLTSRVTEVARSGVETLSRVFDAEQRVLEQGSHSREALAEIMQHDLQVLKANKSDLRRLMTSDELRNFALKFSKGSIYRQGLLDWSAKMEGSIAPSLLIDHAAPAWNAQREAVNQANRRLVDLTEQLIALRRSVKVWSADIPKLMKEEAYWRALPKGGAARATIDTYLRTRLEASAAMQMNTLTGSKVNQISGELGLYLQSEAKGLERSALSSNARGFGKGVGAVSIGIGAGYLADRLTGRYALHSSLGLGLDAASGLLLFSRLPGRYKLPLAIVSLATPRIMDL